MASPSLGLYLLFFFYSDPSTSVCPAQRTGLDCHIFSYPVCAYYSGANCHSLTGYCQRDASSYCEACQDENVLGYDYGECADTMIHVCSQADRTASCKNNDADPVCGFSVDNSNGLVSFQSINGSCNACSNKTIQFYTVGECDLTYQMTNGTDSKGNPTTIDTLELGFGNGGSFVTEEESTEFVLTNTYGSVKKNDYNLTVTHFQSGEVSTQLITVLETKSNQFTTVRYRQE